MSLFFLKISAFYLIKQLLCDDSMIEDIIYIILWIGWRSYELFQDIVNKFNCIELLEKEQGKVKYIRVRPNKNHYLNHFCDILLWYYVSNASTSLKQKMYQTIKYYIELYSANNKEEEVMQRKEITIKMLYYLCFIKNSKKIDIKKRYLIYHLLKYF